jgi:uncharacterized protein (DUF2141 family)
MFKINEIKMKTLSIFIVVFFTVFNSLSVAQNKPDIPKTGILKVVVSGLENNEGDVKIGLYNSEESYNGKTEKFKGAILRIDDQKTIWIVNDIPFGTYAIKVFHDEDSDDEIDTNFLGIPTESYGFSNNTMGLFGPPDFDDAKFLTNSDTTNIEIILK